MKNVRIKIWIQDSPNKKNLYPVQVRITYNKRSQFFATPFQATSKEITKTVPLLLKPHSQILEQVELYEKQLNQAAQSFDPTEFEGLLPSAIHKKLLDRRKEQLNSNPETFRLDFPDYMRKLAETKKYSSRRSYLHALRAFCQFMGKESFDISEIKSSTLNKFEKYLEQKYGGYTKTIHQYVGHLSTAHKQARREYNSEENGIVVIKNPFAYHEHTKKLIRRKEFSATREMIQYMIKNLGEFNQDEKRAATLFLLMFSLQGMNMADIVQARPPKNDIITFHRSKIKDQSPDEAETKVKIHECVKPLHEYFKDPEGEYAYYFAHKYKLQYIYQQETKWMKALRAKLKIEEQFRETADRLKFNSARHAYPTISVAMGIPKEIVSDGMSHINRSTFMTDIYITKDWNRVWEANKLMLESFNWDGLKYL